MLSIVIPARNEESRIGDTLQAYGAFFSRQQIPHEIFVIVNNCSDDTVGVVKKYMKKFPSIRYIDINPPGKGLATIRGFKESKGDYIGFVDADMSTSPRDFYDLYQFRGNYDGIIASRWVKGSKAERSIGKYIRSKGFNYLVRGLFLFPYKDTQCGAKLFRKEPLLKVIPEMISMKWAFDVNRLYLLRKYKFKVKEHPTVWEDKEGSTIDNFLKTPVQMAAGVTRLRLIHSPFNFVVRAYDLFPETIKIHH